jgi:DNA mismatch repair protein MutS
MKRSSLDTPMMRQYLAIKERHPDAILFYRMGDFYEMFLRDAEIAAPLLDIALTTRDRGKEDPVPMCGVPVHNADPYIQRLAQLGYRVAICEQVEDARSAGRRLVRREVSLVVTPGLAGDPESIDARGELCLVALDPGEVFGLAVLDASTGDFRATAVEGGSREADGAVALPAALREELRRVAPREFLLPASAGPAVAERLGRWLPDAARSLVDPESFEPRRAPRHPEGLRPEATDPAARAAAALLAYLGDHQPFALAQVARLRRYRLAETMVLDDATRDHLELFRSAEDGSRRRTLIERLDRTVTALGGRRLARWLAYPLLDPQAIAARQDGVAFLADRDRLRGRLRQALRPVRDLDRILAKAARPTSTPRDLGKLRDSLEALPAVAEALRDSPGALPEIAEARAAAREGPSAPGEGPSAGEGARAGAGTQGGEAAAQRGEAERSAGPRRAGSEPRPPILRAPAPVPEVASLLREALVDEPPAVPRGSRGAGEAGAVRRGFHAELDALREAVAKGREWMAGLEARERERTGIANLRIRFHPVHGYALEVTKAQLARIPPDYERRQTLASAERFATPELRQTEQAVLGARERAAALEREVAESLRRHALEHAAAIALAADAVADLDALASLAEVARQGGWVRPRVDASGALEIRAGRHPVVELSLAERGEEFVPNDALLEEGGTRILVVTGPNMSGKSTYLRQVAQIALLAQIGSFVPAQAARIGVVDRVFTRVGASDRLARGESTFLVEMRETADILAFASDRSLVILDEIGRGTSTFDGLSIAWAVAEYLHDTPGLRPRTLFATHYHELTDLARTKPQVANAHFEARERGEEVVFLRRLAPGGASRSYGIQVARLAGLPHSVIERAREILRNLEGGELDERGRPRFASGGSPAPGGRSGDQLALFDAARPSPEEAEALAALRELDPDRTTPLEALALLARLAARLRSSG